MKYITKNIYLVWCFCCLIAFGAMGQTVTPQGPTMTAAPSTSGGGSGGSGTVNIGTAPQVAYYAASTNAVSPNPQLQFVATETVFNETAQDINLRAESLSLPFMFFLDSGLNKIGINDSAPVNLFDISSTGAGLTTGQYALGVSGELPISTFTEHGVRFDIQSSGSGVGGKVGQTVNFTPGATSTGPVVGFQVISTTDTTGNNLQLNTSFVNPSGNSGINAFSVATTTGTNIGSYNESAGGNLNIGIVGKSNVAKTNATNIGVLGIGNNTLGGTGFRAGGYFGLQNATPTFISAALVADNGATTSPILIARDNGTTAFSILDGGQASHITGTAAIPAIAMGDTNSGFFGGADILGMSIGGVQELNINSTTLGPIAAGGSALGTTALPFATVNVQTGTALLPSVTMGDTNSGIFGGADLLNFSIGGVQETILNATSFSPFAAGGLQSGTTTFPWSAVNAQQGSAAFPAITMGDTNSGMMGGGDVVGVSIGGVQEVEIVATEIRPFAASGLNLGSAALPFGRVFSGNGTSVAPGYTFGAATDAGMSFDSIGNGSLNISNNTGNTFISASEGILIAATSGMDIQSAAGSDISIEALSGGNIFMDSRIEMGPATQIKGDIETAGAAVTGFIRQYGADSITPGAKPTCTAKTDAAYGSVIYWNDSNDAVDGMLCMCNATSAAEAVAWRQVAAPGVACP